MSCGAPTTGAEAAPGRGRRRVNHREAPRQADRQRHAKQIASATPEPAVTT